MERRMQTLAGIPAMLSYLTQTQVTESHETRKYFSLPSVVSTVAVGSTELLTVSLLDIIK